MTTTQAGPRADERRVPLTLMLTRAEHDALLGAFRRDLRRAARETEQATTGAAGAARWAAATCQVEALTDVLRQVVREDGAPPPN